MSVGSKSTHGLRFLGLNWSCGIGVYLFGGYLMSIERDLGWHTPPLSALAYVGFAAQTLLTGLVLGRQTSFIGARVLNSSLLGYWVCLILLLVASCLDLTTGLQQAK